MPLLRLSCCLLLVFFVQLGHAQTPVAWPTKDWQFSTPEAHGLRCPVQLVRLPRHGGLQHGRIVSETYVAPISAELRHDLRSVSKSVVATLVGAALQEGKIASLDQKVLSFFPDQRANGPHQEALAIRHLLDMVKRYLLPAIKGDAALPEDPASRSPVKAHVRSGTERLAASRIRAGAFRPRSKLSTRTSRRTFPYSNMSLGGPMGTPSGQRVNSWRVPSSQNGLRNSPTGN